MVDKAMIPNVTKRPTSMQLKEFPGRPIATQPGGGGGGAGSGFLQDGP
eukprot:CAMPEP_0182617878 /NCGR_PEP_ID=MMETSP1330-20130603/43703_1 /TAXON_ID=464278 /ORGANISM="Picochlorum sp., Strain RCC944" /LENGTH=47 /DNA_ID= /DNA_START= /DNA_END= /DNA_ORIENTATION=